MRKETSYMAKINIDLGAEAPMDQTHMIERLFFKARFPDSEVQ